MMNGLMMKDFRLLILRKQTLLLFLGISILIALTSDTSAFILGYLLIMCVLMVVSTISYDDAENGMSFIMAMPVNGKIYAKQKLLFGLICLGITWVIATIVYMGCAVINGEPLEFADRLRTSAALIPALVIYFAGKLPMQIKLGPEKSRMVAMSVGGIFVAICVFAGRAGIGSKIFYRVVNWLELYGQYLVAVLFVVAIISIFVSYAVTVAIMESKEY